MKKFIALIVFCLFFVLSCKEEKKKEVFKGTFLEVLSKATELVKVESPSAIFAEADATVKDQAMTAEDFTGWKFIYWIDLHNSVIIEYKDSTFSNVTAMPEGIWQDWLITEPIKMTLVEAIHLMREANYDDVIKAGNVKRPLFPGSNEPYYIFGSEKFGHIFVGTISKTVTIDTFPEKKENKNTKKKAKKKNKQGS